ncbi:histidine kinase [Leucobacter allii]|uniref:sensor histidine kinase n=1 Tax=Leucobacter allii TaxID=2932247 RepID=UPI001FD1D73C|nr:histidine kinase [Leucobacter allii]UOR01562.1 histidine kinase [Leucobacter allii]
MTITSDPPSPAPRPDVPQTAAQRPSPVAGRIPAGDHTPTGGDVPAPDPGLVAARNGSATRTPAAPTGSGTARDAATPAASAHSARPPYRIALTILHLAALGIVGLMILAGLLPLFGAGVGLLIVGIGLVFLVALVYALFGIGWFETARVSGLYGVRTAALRWRRAESAGFKGWLVALARQSVDGRMWRAIAHFGIATVLGAIMLGLVQGVVSGTVSTLQGGVVWWQPGLLGAIVCAAGVVGIALLHRIIALAMLGSAATEEQLVAQVRSTAEQREGAVRAADVERTRIERDLHDGVQPRLVSVGMTLGLAQEKIDTDPEAAKALIAEAHTSTKAAITELRQLARGIYASVLDDRGLDAALSALAARSHIPVQLDVRQAERCGRDAEAAVYFAIAETLTNAAKHSRASEARVVVRLREADETGGRRLWARVEDDGIGGARIVPGGGLDGVRNRVLAAGGTSRLDSLVGGPTSLEVSVPCAS